MTAVDRHLLGHPEYVFIVKDNLELRELVQAGRQTERAVKALVAGSSAPPIPVKDPVAVGVGPGRTMGRCCSRHGSRCFGVMLSWRAL